MRLIDILVYLDEKAEQDAVEGVNSVESLLKKSGIDDDDFRSFVRGRCLEMQRIYEAADFPTAISCGYVEAFTVGLLAGKKGRRGNS